MQTNKNNAIKVLQQLIAYPTITPQECGIYAYIKEILSDFEILEFEKEGVKNLFLYKDLGAKNAESQNKKSQKTHLCFAGHIDVVPPGEGWASEPFSPTIKEGFLYGRGAQDMKAGVAAFLCAIREFVDCLESQSLQTAQDSSDSTLQRFNGILSVLLTSDEEGAAIFGTKYTLECLKERDFLPHFAIVAEPTSVEKFGDMIKVGRRGSINGILRVFGKQGHVAYPKKCVNPVELIAPYLSQIAGYELDKGSAEFEPSKLVITDIRGGWKS